MATQIWVNIASGNGSIGAWRHQAITWTNVDFSSDKSHDIYLRPLSWEDLKILIYKTRLKIAHLKLNPDLPGANELMMNLHFVPNFSM